ncbi:S1C family serine protease [Marinicella sp. W31]|uniref:S1C family serine protease n=1 Tax=Marinicella sp. W31 TaxID=3023713 RepID=UPI0037565450
MQKQLMFVLKSVIVGLALGCIYLLINGQVVTGSPRSNAPDHIPVSSYAPAVNKIAPTVVSIYAQSLQMINPTGRLTLRDFNRSGQLVTRNYLGSGLIVSKDGFIVTNKHVIANATRVYISLWNNQIFQARLVGEDRFTDLAVIKIEATDLIPAEFADSDTLYTGDVVLAIGNPYGLNQSASLGIVSATGRKGLRLSPLENFIQTDAAINNGNSGGPLINTAGHVVGINTASYNQHGAVGINFAIPSNMALRSLQSIIEFGEVVRGWIGLNLFTEKAFQTAAVSVQKPEQGVMISRVHQNTPAFNSDLKAYDIITSVNGIEVNSYADYSEVMYMTEPGEKISITGISEGQPFDKIITTTAIPL